jgi:hypothetical protein
MAREPQESRSAAPIDPLDTRADMSGEPGLEDGHDWSLPWPSASARADEPPSRPPKIWGAEPNLGRIWPVHVRPGSFTH